MFHGDLYIEKSPVFLKVIEFLIFSIRTTRLEAKFKLCIKYKLRLYKK